MKSQFQEAEVETIVQSDEDTATDTGTKKKRKPARRWTKKEPMVCSICGEEDCYLAPRIPRSQYI